MDTGYIAIIIVAVIFIGYVTEVLPIPILALLSCGAMVVFGVAPAGTAWSAFGEDSVLLMAGMLTVGISLFSTGAVSVITKRINRISKGNAEISIFIMLILVFILSAFLNNTTVTVLFLPLILGEIIEQNDTSKYYEQKYVQAIAIVAQTGGLLTLVGSGVNVAASGILESYGYKGFSFFEFTPMAVILFVISMVYIYTLGPSLSKKMNQRNPRSQLVLDFMEEHQNAEDQKKENIDTKKMATSISIMVIMSILLMTKELHGISSGTIGILAGLFCVILKCISFQEMIKKINWGTLLTLGGTIGCAKCLAYSGGGNIIAMFLINLFKDSLTPRLATIVFMISALIISQFISNTGAVGILIPVCIPIAQALGVDPLPLVAAITIAASCSILTPMASHIEALIIDWGSYKFNDYLVYAGPLVAVYILVIIFTIPLFYPF